MKRFPLACLVAVLLSACASPAPPGSVATSNGNGEATPTTQAANNPPASQPEPTVSAQSAELISARVPRVQPGSQTRKEALAKELNGFAFDLYHAVPGEQNSNLIYSPHSITTAFSMVYAGARGETEAQMAKVLHFLPQKHQHPAANALERQMAGLGSDAPPIGQEQGEAFQLKVANAVWGQRDFPFLDAFLQTLAQHYAAGVRAVDFGDDPEGVRKIINGWVSDQTKGHIPDILPQGIIDESTRLVLANAIYFKAGWLYPFDENGTQDGPFTRLDGSKVAVPMMHQGIGPTFEYGVGDDYQAVVLPYTGETVEMVVIVPKTGRFEAVEADLGADFLENVRAGTKPRELVLSMPRFDFESQLNLTEILPGMGMPDAFDSGLADFGGINKGGGLFISAALHRATIAVDEKGTEATAATAIAMAASAPATPPLHLTIDRPFIFTIVERETGTILFLGRVMNP